MKIEIISIEHLVIENIEKLGDYILLPVSWICGRLEYQISPGFDDEERRAISYMIDEKAEFLAKFLELEYCTLACRLMNEKKSVSTICYELEKALDYLVITQYRFDRKEWIMGAPGAICGKRIVFIVDSLSGDVETLTDERHLFEEIPGLGLEVSFTPIFRQDEEYVNLFSKRQDDVYRECRYFISKACKTLSLVSLDSAFAELFSTLEGIGMFDIKETEFINFTKENKRIMSVLCTEQEEYNNRLDLYCYYSEVIRTLVLHQGHHLLEYMDRKSAFRLLTDIWFTIINYASNLLETKLESKEEINQYIKEQELKFCEHNSSVKKSFTLINTEKSFDGERDIFIFPLGNFESEEIIRLNNILIIPKNIEESVEESGFYLDKILTDKRIQDLNKEVSIVLYIGNYKMNEININLAAWQYLDDICGAIQEQLVPLYVEREMKIRRDDFFDAVGIYYGFRHGYLYDTYFDEIITLNGRVYSLYNHTSNPYVYRNEHMRNECFTKLFWDKREDIVAYDCRRALQIIGKSMYEDDVTHMISNAFEAIEQLYSIEYYINRKWRWIAGFIMDIRSEYDLVYNRLCEIGEKYRTPLFHYGKSVYDLMSEEEIEMLFIELKEVAFKYINTVYSMNIYTYEELSSKRVELMERK